jgi:starvation-inducible DNA-binding protein
MARDVAGTTHIERPPRGREEVGPTVAPVESIPDHHWCHRRQVPRRAVPIFEFDDLLVSEMLRTNELQAWFLSNHLVDAAHHRNGLMAVVKLFSI